MISESLKFQEREINVYDLNGEVIEKIKFPEILNEKLRIDLIQRAVVSELANKRQPYGTDKLAGLRTSADYFDVRRRTYRITIGRDISRLPRIKPGGGGLGAVRIVPNAVKGRAAHPPKV
ncbi:MAG: 50S ribosomal protein L4, partial [Candidatus Altarchaeaceae archaeon]